MNRRDQSCRPGNSLHGDRYALCFHRVDTRAGQQDAIARRAFPSPIYQAPIVSDLEGSERAAKMRFRKSIRRTRMPADQARRQGEIVALAFTRMGGRDPALDFLNAHNDALDARPLDVASESDEGFEKVAALIAKLG